MEVPPSRIEFFHMKYAAAYVLATLAQWLQCPYEYFLYQSEYRYGTVDTLSLYVIHLLLTDLLRVFGAPARLCRRVGSRRLAVIATEVGLVAAVNKLSSRYPLQLLSQILRAASDAVTLPSYKMWFRCRSTSTYRQSADWFWNKGEETEKWCIPASAVVFAAMAILVEGLRLSFSVPYAVSIPVYLLASVVVSVFWEEDFDELEDTSLASRQLPSRLRFVESCFSCAKFVHLLFLANASRSFWLPLGVAYTCGIATSVGGRWFTGFLCLAEEPSWKVLHRQLIFATLLSSVASFVSYRGCGGMNGLLFLVGYLEFQFASGVYLHACERAPPSSEGDCSVLRSVSPQLVTAFTVFFLKRPAGIRGNIVGEELFLLPAALMLVAAHSLYSVYDGADESAVKPKTSNVGLAQNEVET